jgi:hypothetical protein
MTAATESQLAASVLMIRPARFKSNPMTAASNRFQVESDVSPDEQQRLACTEFERLANALRDSGVEVIVAIDLPEPHTPDAIFPNNWVSFHADGKVVLYPMEAENRRIERRMDVIESLVAEPGFRVDEIVDLTGHEQRGHYLEGTGSMVLDRTNRIAYACLSTRTHLDPLGDFAQRLDYDVVAFDAVDRNGVPIYHTNVLMSIGEELAVICDTAIARDDQRTAVLNRLTESGHDILSINTEQLNAFAGNMLELRNCDDERLTVMSQRAHDSLNQQQLQRLDGNGKILAVAIDNIEQLGGGSVRCMLAEIHLPRSG